MKPTSECWYQVTSLGHNVLGGMVAKMCQSTGLQGHDTNHSLHATSATRMFEASIDEQLIMQRTGHSTTAKVCLYKRVGENLRAIASDVLNGSKRIKVEAATDNQHCPGRIKVHGDSNVRPALSGQRFSFFYTTRCRVFTLPHKLQHC